MTIEQYREKVVAIEAWARDEIAKLGLRPVSVCPKADDHLYEIVRLHAAIAEVEEILRYVSECLDADLYGERRPRASSARAAAVLDRTLVA